MIPLSFVLHGFSIANVARKAYLLQNQEQCFVKCTVETALQLLHTLDGQAVLAAVDAGQMLDVGALAAALSTFE